MIDERIFKMNYQTLDMSKPLLECIDLSKSYVKNTPVLQNLNITIGTGRIIGLLGPNGCGKSTLIKLINGLLTPTSGEIRLRGAAPGPSTASIVSYLPEKSYLADDMTVNETVNFFKDFYLDFSVERAYDMLLRLNINPNQKFKTLSKGTKEKVQLILVLSRNAQLYILDEPIAGVDPAARDYILETMIKNYNRNASIIITTHLIYDIENILDDALFLKNGKIFMAGAVKELEEKYGKDLNDIFREVFRC